MIELNIFDDLEEAIVKLDNLKVIDSNKRGKELGFTRNKEIFEIFACENMDMITGKIIKGEDFKIEEKVLFFSLESKRDVRLVYKSHHNLLLLLDLTPIKNLIEAKRDFVISISHELFNPLSVLKGNVLRMADLNLKGEASEIIQRTRRAILRMERIIKQLKLLSMVELEMYTPKKNTVDPRKVAEEVLADLSDKLNQKNIKVEFKCDIDVIETDGFAFYTILRNLVSNAVKYSYPGSTIRVTMDSSSLTVEDRGIGIREEEKERIFERFYRGKDATKMATGSGLGLSIVKHLCELLNYKLEFISDWLIGSRFTVKLSN